MNNQLSTIAVQYRKFSKGQYIEKSHFNEFLDYFEDQDRLSRVLLQGVGVVCGFKPDLIYVRNQLKSIQLSQGVAITTDGDLLTLNNTSEVSKELYMSDLKTVNIENKKFTHFKAYDNFKVGYPSFYDDKGIEQIELWELATAEEANSDFQPINALSGLQDKYVLLYLEDYEKDSKPCAGTDCDNHGIQQIRNLKVLVTTEKGIINILGEDRLIIDPTGGADSLSRKDRVQPHPLFLDDIMKPVKLERVVIERLIEGKAVEKNFSSYDVSKMYSLALQRNNYGESVFEKINAISNIIGTEPVSHPEFRAILEGLLTKETNFQYAYDVVQDLIDTYSEIINLLPKSFTKCLPDFTAFPKHVMLGKLIQDKQLDFSRHQFYNSPALDDEKAMQRVQFLLNRFSQQVQSFGGSKTVKGVKITPSQKLNPLSNKAIPFYYRTTEAFLKAWNFDKTNNRSSIDNIRYGTEFMSVDSQGPVNYSIDKSSFYNIEGHQGMDCQIAFDQIKEIRDKQQLGFDIMTLSLQELINNKDMSKAYFNEYLEKHPGLEHKRGVEPGGTFVMVYENIGRSTSVVADFSLPYTCCTPKTEVKLSLPSHTICVEENRIPFTVIPVNGEVTANVAAGLNGGVELSNGQYFFNPKLLDVSLWGQEITFSVNGKSTNCSIKVIPQPEVNIVADYVFYPEGDIDSIATTVKMLVSGKSYKDYTYSWDFWDNGSFITLKPDAKGYVSYTYYNLVPTRIPTIKVKVNGSGCTQDIAIRDWYDAPVQLWLPSSVICSTSPAIPFRVSPVGGIVKAVDNGGVELIKGVYYFNPKLVALSSNGQVINFTVNDQPTNCSIKVMMQPDVKAKVIAVNHPAVGSNKTTIVVNFSGDNAKSYAYKGNFVGDWETLELDGDGNVIYTFIDLNPKNIPIIKVEVTNNGCVQEISIKNDWYTPPTSTVVITDIIPNASCCTVELPTINAQITGPDIVYLKQAGFGLQASSDASDPLYFWSKLDGPDARLIINNDAKLLAVTDLRVDTYKFRLLVKERNSSAFGIAEIKVEVKE